MGEGGRGRGREGEGEGGRGRVRDNWAVETTNGQERERRSVRGSRKREDKVGRVRIQRGTEAAQY